MEERRFQVKIIGRIRASIFRSFENLNPFEPAGKML
jgi:hypothetical protein